ncbi:MAG: ZIP family metal transporter [Bacteroidota bacterium]
MLTNSLILFLGSFLAGIAAFILPPVADRKYKLVLVFAGAYLLAITITHILPELFNNGINPSQIGLYVLIGFIFQEVLEYFTSGVEHGHMHVEDEKHQHSKASSIMLIIALFIHAFLEGSLLAHPGSIHADHDSGGLLLGIILHKAPASFALVSILFCQLKNRKKALLFLFIFAMSSPIGMWVGDYFAHGQVLSDYTFSILFAIVSGNFLHISTTIVFESEPNHKVDIQKLGVTILGASLAVMVEFLL